MGNRFHPRVKRTREDIQQCKDCKGNGSMPDPGRPPRLMDCATCNGQGFIAHRAPYRLADGTWSDGVDRSKRINERYVTGRYEVTVSRSSKRATVWHINLAAHGAEFNSLAEAISYADSQARQTTTNGDK